MASSSSPAGSPSHKGKGAVATASATAVNATTAMPKKSRYETDGKELVSQSKLLVFRDWAEHSCYSDFEGREEFTLLGNRWALLFKPIASEYDDLAEGQASILLMNLNVAAPATVSYQLMLKNQLGLNEDVVFSDPEGFVTFAPHDGANGDDAWGSDEFCPTQWLQDAAMGFIQDDSVAIEVTLSKYASTSISKDSTLMRAIEDSKEEEELLAIANEDIEPFRLKYEVSAQVKLQQQEDELVSTRNASMHRHQNLAKSMRRNSSSKDLLNSYGYATSSRK